MQVHAAIPRYLSCIQATIYTHHTNMKIFVLLSLFVMYRVLISLHWLTLFDVFVISKFVHMKVLKVHLPQQSHQMLAQAIPAYEDCSH